MSASRGKRQSDRQGRANRDGNRANKDARLGKSRRPGLPADSTSNDSAAFVGVLACFFLSGFAALIYEVAWMRQFSLVYGTSDLAVATVLAAYMGGLAFGSAVAARWVSRVRRLVMTYGLLELGIAIGALAVPIGLTGARMLLATLVGGQSEPPDAGGAAQSLYYLGTAFLVILVPTALMGATLPLLSRYAVSRDDQLGSRVGLLYAINTAGAVVGVLCAAFILLPAFGLRGTVWCGVVVNLSLFGVATIIARMSSRVPLATTRQPETIANSSARNVADSTIGRKAVWILPLIAGAGFASFTYEVLWTRLLSHVIGGSIHAYATMLASFLTGIALGSMVASRWAKDRSRSGAGFLLAQLGTAVLSLAIFHGLDYLPGLAERSSDLAYQHLVGHALLAWLLLLPASLCIGASLPFAIRILAADEHEAGLATGRVNAWNTFGAIAGATVTGFLLLPQFSFTGTTIIAVTLNIVIALVACTLFVRRSVKPLIGALAAASALAIFWPPTMPMTLLRSSPFAALSSEGEIEYAKVGRSATVLMMRQDGIFVLRTNGLPEASIQPLGAPPVQTYDSQRWLAALPVLARPDASSMLVIGLGGGVTIERVPASVQNIDVIELEPEVIKANRKIGAQRRTDPLTDKRVRLIVNDARNALALTTKRYDLIISQPSHPWTAGASHLYTQEFLSLARDHLNRKGVLLQWMNLHLVDEELLRSLGATLMNVFDHVRVYQPSDRIALFLASDSPLDVEQEMFGTVAPPEFLQLGIYGPDDLAAVLVTDRDGLAEFCHGAETNTDDRNRMAVARRDPSRPATTALDRLASTQHPLVRERNRLDHRASIEFNYRYIASRLVSAKMPARAELIARNAPNEIQRLMALPWTTAKRRTEYSAELRRMLELDPGNQDAAFLMLEPALSQLTSRNTPRELASIASRLRDPTAAVVEGWQHAQLGQWYHLSQLDERLARAAPTDACHRLAVHLRAGWRCNLGGPKSSAWAQEAMQIIDRALALYPSATDILTRLDAARAADRPHDLLETADVLADKLTAPGMQRSAQGRGFAMNVGKTAIGMLSKLRSDPRVSTDRVDVVRSRFEHIVEHVRRIDMAARLQPSLTR